MRLNTKRRRSEVRWRDYIRQNIKSPYMAFIEDYGYIIVVLSDAPLGDLPKSRPYRLNWNETYLGETYYDVFTALQKDGRI